MVRLANNVRVHGPSGTAVQMRKRHCDVEPNLATGGLEGTAEGGVADRSEHRCPRRTRSQHRTTFRVRQVTTVLSGFSLRMTRADSRPSLFLPNQRSQVKSW